MTVKRVDKLSWSRSGRPVTPSDRKLMLAVLRKAKREGRVHERERIEKDCKSSALK
jgi:hypothetical protein